MGDRVARLQVTNDVESKWMGLLKRLLSVCLTPARATPGSYPIRQVVTRNQMPPAERLALAIRLWIGSSARYLKVAAGIDPSVLVRP